MFKSALGTVVTVSLLAFLSAPPPQTPKTDDNRVATVIDRQGIAVVQPAGHQRWTPLRQKSLLLPGDTVRTDARGANALELELAAGGSLVLGPGSLLELTDATTLHLLHGEVEVTPKQALRVTGPGSFDRTFAATAVLRADDASTKVLTDTPRWLSGYRASTTDEWLGSLLATVDGRAVPLHLGYHKVDAVIKDQLCETTIEESFVNDSGATLEGVFRFPLPADAAIAGFGMWVGNELVEADVVERGRARQIYEEILRRKKDPGLLEWAGGNIFQANVYPIPPHGEKRIRIRYTQVLAREGTTLRYRYALKSELTRAHPLRDLQIAVTVQSELPIGTVSSPTHELQLRQDQHTATARFSAQEYTPQQDFELQIPLTANAPVTTIAHSKDGEGWFLAWLSLPGSEAGWQRATTPESAPLDLVLVADTSGSMQKSDREAQQQFVAAMLQLLSPQDRFRLLCCDVAPHWLQQDAAPADAEHRQAALDFLQQRSSLGWTDLDAAFAAVTAVSTKDTLVVYVGDGIETAGDADGNALAQRLTRLAGKGRFCAVATGSSFDKAVLTAIAAQGGSLREVGDDAAASAFALLDEAAAPALRDVHVRFDRLSTAAVYPTVLPNLARGAQQVVVGRFDPNQPLDKPPSITVTGMLDGREQAFTSLIELPADGGGNSFVPRLWARAHIDALLLQGGGKPTQDAIVAASQRYGIITPYTSLLVLENDADRQEFGVVRTVKASDGEAFFAKARDAAQQAALQQAMAQARSWRLQLRLMALQQIKALGADLYGWNVAWGESPRERTRYDTRGGDGGLAPAGFDIFSVGSMDPLAASESGALGAPVAATAVPEESLSLGEAPAAKDEVAQFAPADESANFEDFEDGPTAGKASARSRKSLQRDGGYRGPGDVMPGRRGYLAFDDDYATDRPASTAPELGFPTLPAAAADTAPPPDPDWPAFVLELVRGLDRREWLQHQSPPLQLLRIDNDVDDDAQLLRQQVHELLWSQGTWVARDTAGVRSQPPFGDHIEFLRDGVRGTLRTTDGLARQRPAAPTDARWPDFELPGMASQDIRRDYRHWTAAVTANNGTVITVTLSAPDGTSSIELDIDPARQVLQKRRDLQAGHVRQLWRYAGVVEVAGVSFVTTSSHEDVVEGRTGDTQRLDLHVVEAAPFADAVQQWLAPLQSAIVLPAELPTLDAARAAVRAGSASLAERFALLQDELARSRWPAAMAQWQALATLVQDRPGAAWLRARLLSMARQGEAAVAAVQTLADDLAADATGAAPARADLLARGLAARLGADRMLDVMQRLDAVMQLDQDLVRRFRWQLLRVSWLQNAGKPDQALAVTIALEQAMPTSPAIRLQHARQLAELGYRPAAIALLRQACGSPWQPRARDQLFTQLTDLLWQERDLPGLLVETQRWTTAQEPLPTSHDRAAWLRWLSVQLFATGASLDPDVAKLQQDPDAWVAALLQQPLDPDADPVQRAQLQAALQFALGEGWNFYKYELDDGEAGRTLQVLQRLLQLDRGGFLLARPALDNWRFHSTDAARRLRAQLAAALLQDGAVARMPLERLAGSLAAVDWNSRSATERRQLAAALQQRWQLDQDPAVRAALAPHILSLCGDDGAAKLSFLRLQLTQSRRVDCATAARSLFEALSQEPWNEAGEGELLALLVQLKDPWAAPDAQVHAVAGGVRKAADALLAGRQRSLLGDEQLLRQKSRQEQKALRTKARDAALGELAAALQLASGREGPGKTEKSAIFGAGAEVYPPLAELLASEALCLSTRFVASRTPAALAQTLDAAVRLGTSLAEHRDAPLHREQRERCRLVAAYLACASKADAALIDKVLAGYTAEAGNPDDQRSARTAIVRLLLALDRIEALRATLQSWLAPGRFDRTSCAMLGLLQAESGDLDAAIATFASLEAGGLLTPTECAALADWRLVRGDADGRARAIEARFDAMSTDELHRLCYGEQNRIERRGEGVPDDLDPMVVTALQTLLQKAERPDNHLWVARGLYRPTKDFRVLAALASGVPGHDLAAMFEYLKDVQGQLAQVHEEAALDALLERAAALQAAATAELDRRGLQWLIALASLRAAEVAGVAEARAADLRLRFVAAADLPITADEALGVANLVATIQKFPGEAGRQACLRVLDRCVAACPDGSARQLACALQRAEVQWRLDKKRDAASGLLPVFALQRTANQGRLPPRAASSYSRAQTMHLELGLYADWERELVAEIERQPPGDFLRSMQRLHYGFFAHCLEHHGACSLGAGLPLYQAARDQLQKVIVEVGRLMTVSAPAAAEVPGLVQSLCQLATAAQKGNVTKDSAKDLFAFARGPLQTTLPHLPRLSADMLQQIGRTLAKLGAPRDAIALLLLRAHGEPPWLQRVGDDAWRQFHYDLANYRKQAGNLGDQQQPLRNLVLAAMDHQLRSMNSTGSEFWDRDNDRFWSQLAGAFLETAQHVVATSPDKPAVQAFVASYLWNDLHDRPAAIAVLQALDTRKQLDLPLRQRLCIWLQDEKRFAESLPHLELLIAAFADAREQFDPRNRMVRALHETGDDTRALEVLLASEAKLGSIADLPKPELALALLGTVAVDCGFAAPAARMLTAAIDGRSARAPLTKAGDPARARWYASLSRAHSQLIATAAAVDAAGAAVICAGNDDGARAAADQAMAAAVHAIADLDAYVKARDAETDKTGLDSPVVQKALGAEYFARGQYQNALARYQLARQLQPNDRDTRQRIAKTFDQLGQPRQACAELQQALIDNPADAALTLDLAARYAKLGDEAAAERARTQLVEPATSDAAGHRALAELRDQQQLPQQALVQWQHVVRLCSFEPDGYLGLANAAAAANDLATARANLKKVIDGEWAERFAKTVAQAKARLRELGND